MREALWKLLDPSSPTSTAQFVGEHGYNKEGGYSYHHCTVLKITADPSKPVDSLRPAPR